MGLSAAQAEEPTGQKQTLNTEAREQAEFKELDFERLNYLTSDL